MRLPALPAEKVQAAAAVVLCTPDADRSEEQSFAELVAAEAQRQRAEPRDGEPGGVALVLPMRQWEPPWASLPRAELPVAPGAVLSQPQAGAERPVARPVARPAPEAELVSPLEERPRRGARVGPESEAQAPQSERAPEVSRQRVASAAGAVVPQYASERPSLPSFE